MNILILIFCYLIGSIPFAYVVVKLVKGIDIRQVGSGNVGATNVGRVIGKWGFISVFLLDMLKGLIPLLIINYYFPNDPLLLVLSATALILGHTYTIFLKFKGGKGVATAVGIFGALAPINLLIAAIAFGLAVLIFKMVSLGSILAAVILGISILFMDVSIHLKVFTIIIGVFVIFKHRENIKRIINGTESKIGEKVNEPS